MIKEVPGYAVDKSKTAGDIEVISFTKDVPYVLDLTFYRYEFEKPKEMIKGYKSYRINDIY